jgi:capsule polysaccharide modification protein KpsS
MSSQFSPSVLMKHLMMGSVRFYTAILTTQMESWGFFKSSVSYLLVHMELSLHLSFYLRHSLGGYTVDTTTGFPVMIVYALAP